MPMAGEGSRFLKEGWKTPKPLIQLNGKTLFELAISSITSNQIRLKYSFIVRQEHIDKYKIDQKIHSILPSANVFSVEKTTRGAVETCLIAESAIEKDDSIIVLDCDIKFKSQQFILMIENILSQPIEQVNGGVLVSFDSNNPIYSYAEIDHEENVIRTAEKEVISKHALCGAYFFSSSQEFLDAAHQLLEDTHFNKPEFYVSLLYNYLLKKKDQVKLAKIDEYYSFGTPEELRQYL